MRILVVVGPEYTGPPSVEELASAIATATQEMKYINQAAPKDTPEGWIWVSCEKANDDALWAWKEYALRIGTCEVGRHTIDKGGNISPTSDIKTYLIQFYHDHEEESEDESSHDSNL